MEIKNKEWLDILGRNADYHGDPLIILDDSYEIVFTNQTASTFFNIDDFHISLEQVFEEETVQELNDYIGPVLHSFQKKVFNNISFNLKSGNNIVFDLLIEPIQTDETNNIILFFRNIESINANDLLSKIKITSVKDDFSNKENPIKTVISELQRIAPFTIISFKRVQNLINQYDYPIWIKDVESKLIAVNNSYAEILGVEASFAAGKKHDTFLPPHQKAIYKMLDQYIIINTQQIILEGFSKKVKNFEAIKNIIQVPLVDNFNKILAIVGLIVDNKCEYYNFWGEEEFFIALINSFSKPTAYFTFEGEVKGTNQRFRELLNINAEQVVNNRIDELFPLFLVRKMYSFIQSDQIEESIVLKENFNTINSSQVNAELLLVKLSSFEKNRSIILLTIETPGEIKKSEDELENILMHRGTMFDILIQRNPEPIFVYDKENLKFLEVNDAAIRLYGYSHEEFLQMDLTDLYAPEDIQTLLDSFGDEASESRFSKPFRHRKKDGSNVLVEISKTSFRFNDREAHFNIVKDITDSVEKEKQNQMLRTISNESDLMVFSTDSSGFVTFINNNVTENLGYSNDEVLQSSFTSLVTDDDRGIVNNSIFQSHLKDTVFLESKIKNRLGDLTSVKITASPILDFDGAIDSFTIIVKQFPVKSYPEEPKEIINEVIKEVIKEVVVEKPETTQQKSIIPDSNFLSGMFHEILTPINVIIGFSQELISSTENPTEEQLEASEIINQNRIKMMDTMNAVVEYSDIMQNKSPLKIEDITITDVIEKLDNNINDITGINDIQFSYGKISSSLKFKSDKQKFENFILSLIKVVSRLSKDKKVYFSAFPLDSESFLIGISDQYGNPSEYVANVLEQVFAKDKDPKDFGLPKLTSYLARILLNYLDGKFYKSSSVTVRNETGFIFPVQFSAGSSEQKYESIQESISLIASSENNKMLEAVSEDEIISKPMDVSGKSTESIDDKNLSTDNSVNKEPYESTDVFKPVPPVAQELLSKLSDQKIIQDDSIQQEIQTYEMLSQEVKPEQVSPLNFDTTESDTQQNLTEAIQNELANESENIPEVKPPQSLDLAKLNCLYIEDQVDSQILFKVQMKGLNDVKFAVSFEEAQLLLLNHQFDFIVMDINLQGEYNGLDALKIIKTMPAFSSIPIIAVTAYVLPGDKEKFIAAGFDDFISKPIFKEKMMESLEKIFLSKY